MFFFKGKRYIIVKFIIIIFVSNIIFKSKCVLKRDYKNFVYGL